MNKEPMTAKELGYAVLYYGSAALVFFIVVGAAYPG